MSDLKHTQRGFAYIEFLDCYEHKCSLQKSSLATEDAIWFGIDDANPQVLHVDAHRLGIETDATSGWVPYPLPAEVSLATRMHLTQDQVRELLPTLIHFAETGDVLAPADCRAQPEATAPAQDQQLVVATSTETGFFHVVISLNDGKRMLVLYDKQHSLNGDTVGVADVPAAALASSANALSAGDRVDAVKTGTLYQAIQRAAGELPDDYTIRIEIEQGSAVVEMAGADCEWVLVDGNDGYLCQAVNAATDRAILQSQKGGSHG